MRKISFILLILCGIGLYTIIKADTGELSLEITKGPIAIDTSGSITLNAVSFSVTTGEITGSFTTNTFMMIDKRGGPGYYTTVQFDDLIQGSNRIANENIQFKTLSNPNIIYGNSNAHMRFGSGINNQFGLANQPMTYFVRKPNEGTGEIGQYGDTPDIKITVPANQTGGAYTGVIYYTLIDRE